MATVRVATADDATAIGEVSVLAWQAAYRGIMPDAYLDGLSGAERAERWSSTLAKPPPRSRVLVAEDDGRVVGFAAVGPCPDDEQVGELVAINLRPESWGRGIGSDLLQAAGDRLCASGFHEAVLWMAPANDRAPRFYETRGWWCENVERDELVHDIVVRAVRYRRTLSGPRRGRRCRM